MSEQVRPLAERLRTMRGPWLGDGHTRMHVGELLALHGALSELVELKAIKDRLEHPTIADLDSGRLPEMRRNYEARKEAAWARARGVLAA